MRVRHDTGGPSVSLLRRMARFDDLPADQKAVLQLVLRQGRTYEEIATLLKISPEAVRDRALTALDAIGPQSVAGLDEQRQDEIGDYLLGQQPESARDATHAYLEGSRPGRQWARAVAGELRGAGVAGEDALPAVPADPAEADEADEADGATGALAAGGGARADHERSSRLGGLLLIVAAVIVVAGGVLLLTGVIGGGGDDGGGGSADVATTATTTSTSSVASVEQQINLTPPGGGKQPLGVANIVSQDGQRAIAVVGQDLPASGHYVLWLRNGGKVKFLGFFPVVTDKGTNKGKLQGLVAAPSDLSSYRDMLISREPSSTPKQPTTIVLQGQLKG